MLYCWSIQQDPTAMSVVIHTRGEAGGGVAAHLQCPHCGHLSKSHAQQLSHLAASHPTCLDDVAVGRLGNILMYQSSGRLFHCSECFYTYRDFTKLYKHIIARHCMKSVSVSHIVRKHEIPKIYASHALTRSREVQMGGVEEEDGIGLSEEMMKEEIKVTEKLVGFVSHRFVCLVCNWRSKLKGFVLTHIERHHDVERRYGCKECPQKFFLPSRLQQHVRTVHRPGRYACPFCWFRSEFLGGFRRHCSRCNAREEEGGISVSRSGEFGAPRTLQGRDVDTSQTTEPSSVVIIIVVFAIVIIGSRVAGRSLLLHRNKTRRRVRKLEEMGTYRLHPDPELPPRLSRSDGAVPDAESHSPEDLVFDDGIFSCNNVVDVGAEPVQETGA
ncbi:hypothetical protein GOODEAATRI_001852 [Goodea atripinnis]|uniref:C2H2-type domain-containing protein n=1 Tax=Goodea atripinnis TaxID=208336 RepID=A0ABV0PUG6_9TELE